MATVFKSTTLTITMTNRFALSLSISKHSHRDAVPGIRFGVKGQCNVSSRYSRLYCKSLKFNALPKRPKSIRTLQQRNICSLEKVRERFRSKCGSASSRIRCLQRVLTAEDQLHPAAAPRAHGSRRIEKLSPQNRLRDTSHSCNLNAARELHGSLQPGGGCSGGLQRARGPAAAEASRVLTMVSRTRLWKSCSLTDTSSASILREHNSESSGFRSAGGEASGGRFLKRTGASSVLSAGRGTTCRSAAD